MTYILDLETKLWKRLMHNKYYRNFNNHFYYFYYYDDYIRQFHRRTNQQPQQQQQQQQKQQQQKRHQSSYKYDWERIDYDQIDFNDNRQIKRSFWNVILPGLMSTIQTIGAGLYVIKPDYFRKFAFIGTFERFNPSEGREYFLTAWTIAAFSVVIMMFYCLPTTVKKFQFLRILRLNENNNHYLDDDEFKRFKQLRERIFSIVRTFALIIELVNPFGFIPIIIELEAYKISMFWTIIWFIIVHVNLWYLSVAQYFGPIFVSLLQYYFRLRQRNLKKRLIRLQKFFQQYNQLDDQQQQQLINQRILFRQINVEIYRINRLYGKLRQEIHSSSKQLRRFVTTIFIDLCLQATYLISVVVYTKLAPAITLVILQITTGITTMLIIFMYSSSMLEYEDRKFFTIKQQCLNFFYLKRNIVTSKNLIKFGTPIERSFGFTLIHDIVISSSLSVNVFINISSFFFLISAHIR